MHNKEVEHIVSNAEQLLNTNPDSSLFILDNIRENKPTWSRSQQMRYELVYAQAQNKAFVNFTTDSIALVLVDYYNRHGNANEQMMANYILGCTYRDLGSAPKALEAYRDAVESADTTDVECDFRQLMLIHSQMAYLYQIIQIPEAEEQEIERAILLASRIQDYNSVNVFKELKCNLLLKKNNFQGCICLSDSLYQTYIQQGNYYEASRVCVSSAKAYIALAEYDSAKVYLDRYSNIFKTDVSIRTIRGGKDAYNILKGRHYLGIEKVDSALVCFNNVNIRELEASIKDNVYKDISDAYKVKHKLDSAYKYLALHSTLSNKLYDRAVAEASINAKHLYDYSVEQKIAKQKSAEASMLKTYLIWTLIAIIILFSLTVYIRYRKLLAQKEAADLRIAHNKAMTTLRSAEEQLNILTSQKEEVEKLLLEETIKSSQYNDELSSINQEILAKSAEIDQLRNMIEQFEKMIEPDKHSDANELLCQSEIVRQFRNSLTAKGDVINSKHWNKLQDTIIHLFPNFESVVNRNRELSKKEFQVCMLVKARFSPSEIEYIMNMKHSYATNARKRLHNTIFGYPGSGEEFDRKILFIK
ncbi:MAG: hypothetical protein IIW42_09670 [Bacteroidaceae bacterium]|nr:hypothetical protein [Bacteroidaceae bacterium]